MSLLAPPQCISKNFYDQGKFNLIWYTYLIFFVLSFTHTVLHFFTKSNNLYFTSVGLLLATTNLLLLYFTKSIKLSSYISIISATIVIQFMIFTQINPDRTVDIIWIATISILSFYILNYKWGIFSFGSNFLGLIVLQIIMGDSIKTRTINNLSIGDQIDYYMNIIFGLIIISYLMVRFIKENSQATNLYVNANAQLTEQNSIINQHLEEKTIMLKEIHHRVKNNLQIITSLLRLQSNDIKDEKTIQQFKKATDRVVAMSLIHEQMYQTNNLSKIELKSYLETLTQDLIRSYAVRIPISIKVDTDVELISPKYLVSFALIFNELTSNSIKHAFKDKKEGEINILIKQIKNDLIVTYSDNGNWINNNKQNSFGSELIDTLTNQLDGSYTINKTKGTIYVFTLPFNDE